MTVLVVLACAIAGCAGPLTTPESTVAPDCVSERPGILSVDGIDLVVQRAVAVARSEDAMSIRLATFDVPPEVLADPSVGTTGRVDLPAGQAIMIVDLWNADGAPITSATYLTDPDSESQSSGGLLVPSGARSLGAGAVALTGVSGQSVCGHAAFVGVTARFTAPVVRS